MIARYTHGPGIDEPISVERDTNSDGILDTTYYYVADGLGSIVKLVDASDNVVNNYVYDSFGNMVDVTEAVPNFYTYTGREFDSESGLYYYRARYYDSNIGRFISEDPIWDVNLYAYVRNNPIKDFDPKGLSGSRPGGPYYPPSGVKTRCYQKDDCQTLKGKMWALQRMITSHTGWDRNVPKPRGGNRHISELNDLWNAYAKCQAIYDSKCCGQDVDLGKAAGPYLIPLGIYLTYKTVMVLGGLFLGGPVGAGLALGIP